MKANVTWVDTYRHPVPKCPALIYDGAVNEPEFIFSSCVLVLIYSGCRYFFHRLLMIKSCRHDVRFKRSIHIFKKKLPKPPLGVRWTRFQTWCHELCDVYHAHIRVFIIILWIFRINGWWCFSRSTVDQEFDSVSGFLLKRTKDMVNKYRQLLVREAQVRRVRHLHW